MAKLIALKKFTDLRGSLTVLEKEIPFQTKRVFFIEGVSEYVRGGHRHKSTLQALICLNGSCIVSNNDGKIKQDFLLDASDKCLILEKEDWHTMHSFSDKAILLVLASTEYDQNDYIDEPYPES